MTLYKNNYLYYTSLLSSKLKIIIFATHTIKKNLVRIKKNSLGCAAAQQKDNFVVKLFYFVMLEKV